MSGVSSASSASSMLRVTGMASGLDVDSTVKQLMSAYNTRLDKMKQDRQLVQWRQDLYREVIDNVNTFKSTYFDQLNRDNYMLSSGSYSNFDISTVNSLNSTATPSASVTAGASAVSGQYLVQVTQLAQESTLKGDALANTVTSSTKLTDLNGGLNAAGLNLSLTYNNGSGATTTNVTLDNSSGTKTISDLINAISTQTSGNVTASFSQLTGQFTLKTASTGASTAISVDAASNATLTTALGNIQKAGAGQQDAIAKIAAPGVNSIAAGTTVTKSSNSFAIDGVNYNLKKADDVVSGEYSIINVNTNVDKTFDKVKGFIDKYNDMIDKIQTKIEEKKNLSYPPLTDAQKESMTDDQIKAWEDKAKQGILKGDSSLQSMLDSMRGTFYAAVQDAGISLTDAGLSTSTDITQRGKIILTQDSTGEYKLKSAIRDHGAQLVNLFTKTSDIPYSVDNSAADRATRYNQSGIFQRINDIMNDYTTTTLNSGKHRGILVDKAGIKNTISEYSNSIYTDLVDRDKAISDMKEKITDKENQYYSQFSKLETYMNQMNSQSSWLSSQLGR